MITRTQDTPVGSRVRLLFMGDDPHPIAPGSLGTVVGRTRLQLLVKWDSGRRLMLVPEDEWEVVDGAKPV